MYSQLGFPWPQILHIFFYIPKYVYNIDTLSLSVFPKKVSMPKIQLKEFVTNCVLIKMIIVLKNMYQLSTCFSGFPKELQYLNEVHVVVSVSKVRLKLLVKRTDYIMLSILLLMKIQKIRKTKNLFNIEKGAVWRRNTIFMTLHTGPCFLLKGFLHGFCFFPSGAPYIHSMSSDKNS